jgi:hypothetical protein
MKWVFAAAAAMVLCAGAPAYGQVGDSDWLMSFRSGDSPFLHAVPGPGSMGNEVQAFRCPGGGACEEAPTPMTSEGYIDLTAMTVGDVYEIRWSREGAVVKTVRTPVWAGPYVVTEQPVVQGTAAVGGTLTAVGAKAGGGWGSPYTSVGLSVCPTPQGNDCQALGPGGNPIVLDARWAGWYAFATSEFSSGARANGDPVSVVAQIVYPHPVGPLASGP